MDWLKKKLDKHHHKDKNDSSSDSDEEPPAWAPAPEKTHEWGRYTDASNEEYDAGKRFCSDNPVWTT